MEAKVYPVHIRLNDLDSFGHVNNAVYLTYFEEARLMFFHDLIGTEWNWHKHGVILARNEIDYKLPLDLSDNAKIEVWISALGRKSFEVSYRITKQTEDGNATCTTGKSVAVCIDYQTRKTIPVPDEWRKAVEKS